MYQNKKNQKNIKLHLVLLLMIFLLRYFEVHSLYVINVISNFVNVTRNQDFQYKKKNYKYEFKEFEFKTCNTEFQLEVLV